MAKKKKWWSTKTATRVHENEDGESWCEYHDQKLVRWTKDKVTLDFGPYGPSPTSLRRMKECAHHYELFFLAYKDGGKHLVKYVTGHFCNREEVTEEIPPQRSITFPRYQKARHDCADCGMAILAAEDRDPDELIWPHKQSIYGHRTI